MIKEDQPVSNFEDIVLLMICPSPTEQCFFGQCKACPEVGVLKNLILDILRKNDVKEISHKNWVSQPKTELKNVVLSSIEFIEIFCKS